MRKEDFDLLSNILKERSGLVLSEDKVYLLESRLTPIARKKGMETLDDLINEVRLRRKEDLLNEITEAMTTNESFFFRDNTPFDLLREDVLPTLLQSRAASKRLRFWCSAASTGQELLFHRHYSQGNGGSVERLANRYRRDGPFQQGAGQGQGRSVFAV